MTGVRIVSAGAALPEQVVTNDDLAQRLDTTNEWIVERTGIHQRHFGGTTSELAVRAAQQALQRAAVLPGDIDLLILATSTGDQAIPQTAAKVQHVLGTGGGALDISVGCSGFVYGLALARGMIVGGMHNVLVIGAETLSNIIDPNDRTTAVLFGDGAGAVIVSSTDDDAHLATDLGSNGAFYDLLSRQHGGYVQMAGKEVYRNAVLVCVESLQQACHTAGVEPKDISLFVPHQANIRIINAIVDRVGIERDRSVIVLDRLGNTSAASIPLALTEAIEQGRIAVGDIVALSGFGAGMAWATQLWRWT